eukprot:TRINITY_DN24910_c0_g1_i1.p1 TRINITY_DN24910_c0_g1~~TRINITY_DN24910_c0_g1_i1.p1  ORF type:complete len:1160 (+),score=219.76 TRINITY_DN24910_c0_g1_i1:321-3482(+)
MIDNKADGGLSYPERPSSGGHDEEEEENSVDASDVDPSFQIGKGSSCEEAVVVGDSRGDRRDADHVHDSVFVRHDDYDNHSQIDFSNDEESLAGGDGDIVDTQNATLINHSAKMGEQQRERESKEREQDIRSDGKAMLSSFGIDFDVCRGGACGSKTVAGGNTEHVTRHEGRLAKDMPSDAKYVDSPHQNKRSHVDDSREKRHRDERHYDDRHRDERRNLLCEKKGHKSGSSAGDGACGSGSARGGRGGGSDQIGRQHNDSYRDRNYERHRSRQQDRRELDPQRKRDGVADWGRLKDSRRDGNTSRDTDRDRGGERGVGRVGDRCSDRGGRGDCVHSPRVTDTSERVAHTTQREQLEVTSAEGGAGNDPAVADVKSDADRNRKNGVLKPRHISRSPRRTFSGNTDASRRCVRSPVGQSQPPFTRNAPSSLRREVPRLRSAKRVTDRERNRDWVDIRRSHRRLDRGAGDGRESNSASGRHKTDSMRDRRRRRSASKRDSKPWENPGWDMEPVPRVDKSAARAVGKEDMNPAQTPAAGSTSGLSDQQRQDELRVNCSAVPVTSATQSGQVLRRREEKPNSSLKVREGPSDQDECGDREKVVPPQASIEGPRFPAELSDCTSDSYEDETEDDEGARDVPLNPPGAIAVVAVDPGPTAPVVAVAPVVSPETAGDPGNQQVEVDVTPSNATLMSEPVRVDTESEDDEEDPAVEEEEEEDEKAEDAEQEGDGDTPSSSWSSEELQQQESAQTGEGVVVQQSSPTVVQALLPPEVETHNMQIEDSASMELEMCDRRNRRERELRERQAAADASAKPAARGSPSSPNRHRRKRRRHGGGEHSRRGDRGRSAEDAALAAGLHGHWLPLSMDASGFGANGATASQIYAASAWMAQQAAAAGPCAAASWAGQQGGYQSQQQWAAAVRQLSGCGHSLSSQWPAMDPSASWDSQRAAALQSASWNWHHGSSSGSMTGVGTAWGSPVERAGEGTANDKKTPQGEQEASTPVAVGASTVVSPNDADGQQPNKAFGTRRDGVNGSQGDDSKPEGERSPTIVAPELVVAG